MDKATNNDGKIEAWSLYQNFRPFGWDDEDKNQQVQEGEDIDQRMKGLAINAVIEEIPGSHPWVYPTALGEELDNWEAYDCAILMSNMEM
ncbi:putative esterase protein [Corchorus olitorius]|uniref:Esterase protein n=1 Tax=Corchorus olitorius TaxID=93759 RepID=A0A1R3FWU6_9ROSI|nr:putative esterase protein [Corchorus olitorius]